MLGYLNYEKAQTIQKLINEYVNDNSVCLEIGIYCGKSLMHLLAHSNPKKVIGIDPFIENVPDSDIHIPLQKDMLGALGTVQHTGYKFETVKSLFEEFNNVEIVKAFSPVLDLELQALNYVYIDGDHSYESVLADLRWVYPKTDGVIILDDIHMDSVRSALEDFGKPYEVSKEQFEGNQIAWIKT